MKAVQFFGPRDVRVSTVPDPVLAEPDDVLVRITRAAICGSDLHVYRGDMPGMTHGGIMGHEFTGVVESVGDHAQRVKPGDRVVGTFHVGCGTCGYCRQNLVHQCVKGGVLGYGLLFGNLPGVQAEYARIPYGDVNLRLIPDAVSDDQAIFCGDILTTAYGAVVNSGLRPGEICVVIGAGPVGLMAVMAARLMGASYVFSVDRDGERAQAAAQYGAIPVPSDRVNPVRKIMKATDSIGADVVIEAVGGTQTLGLAFQLVRGGGRISALGVTSETDFAFPLTTALTRDLTFRIGQANIHRDIDATLKLVEAGRIDPTQVVSHRVALEEAPEAYSLFDQRLASKVLFTI